MMKKKKKKKKEPLEVKPKKVEAVVKKRKPKKKGPTMKDLQLKEASREAREERKRLSACEKKRKKKPRVCKKSTIDHTKHEPWTPIKIKGKNNEAFVSRNLWQEVKLINICNFQLQGLNANCQNPRKRRGR